MSHNSSKTDFVLASIALAAVCLSCTFIKGKLSKDPFANIETPFPSNLPTLDPNAPPLVSPGAEVMKDLAELDPSLKPLVRKFEEVELAAQKKLFDELRKTAPRAGDLDRSDSTGPACRPSLNIDKAPALSALSMMQAGDITTMSSDSRANAMGTFGMSIGIARVLFINSMNRSGLAGGDNKRTVETKDGVTTTSGTTLILREDGTSVFGMESKTEYASNGKKVAAEMTGSVDGDHCPNAEGQVQLTVKLRVGGEADGVGYSQDITAFVRTTVDDGSNLASTTVDFTQGTRKVSNGREVYIETGATYAFSGNDARNGSQSNWRVIRNSQSAAENIPEAKQMAQSGQQTALTVSLKVLEATAANWQNGGCVQIVADSPGSVAVSSSTQIPVKVVHKFGGAEVPSKLEAVLSGESSVDPTLIPKTAGTLTYVAPGETGKSATIKLTATSKRGKATLDLTASTGGDSYQIVGGLDDWQTNTKVCDIMKPFTLTGLVTMRFSGGLSGSYEYSGGPFNANGSGTYTISLPDGPGEPGTMTGGGSGQITGDKVYTGKGTEQYKLTPIEPCQ